MQNGKSLLHFHDVASSTKSTHRSAKKQFCNNLNLNDNPNVRDGTGVSMVFVKT